MKFLKPTVWAGAAVIGCLLIPWLFLKVTMHSTPKLAGGLAALAIEIIPIEIALFLIYFNIILVRAFLKAIKLRSRANFIKTCLVLPLGDLLLGYTFVTAIKAFWLK